MKRIPIPLLALGTAGLLGAQAALGDVSNADKEFAKRAARTGHAEVELGRIGQTKATDPQVKQFAEMVIDDHSRANRKLQDIAAEKSMELPSEPDSAHQQALHELREMSGAEFDRAFMARMVEGHNESTALFERQASSGTDEDLRKFASETLPTLERHLDMAKERHAALEAEDGTARARMKGKSEIGEIEEMEE